MMIKLSGAPTLVRILVVVFVASCCSLFSPCGGVDTLSPTKSLSDGESLVSAGGSFELGFFSPNRSTNRYVGIWYHNVPVQTVVWVANRKNPITSTNGTLSITGNGTVIISSEKSIVLWSSATSSSGGVLINPVAQLLDDGNFVVREANSSSAGGGFAWQSFDYPGDTFLPGMKFGVNLKTSFNRNITAWKTESDPSPSSFTSAMDVRGVPQLIMWDGTNVHWRGGPWNGIRISGVPDTKTYTIVSADFVANSDEVYYSYHLLNSSIITRITVNPAGLSERLVWINRTMSWNVYWSAPKDDCDSPSRCGPYGVCNSNKALICDCMQGFSPKNPENWGVREWGDGCVRKTELDCENATDGFQKIGGAKLPDTSSASADMSLSLDQCEAACLKNCSCTAYASANIGGGTGCIFWTTDLTDVRVYLDGGQDLYVRLAAADLTTISASHKSHKNKVVIVVASLASVIVAFILVACFISRRLKRRPIVVPSSSANRGTAAAYIMHSAGEELTENEDIELPLFDFKEISAATDYFSNNAMLGEGGFGIVYRGKLPDGKEIAVKRLSRTSLQGVDEFKNEVTLIAKLQHRNLVRLLGCCVEGEERMLVYEYMRNRSLDAFLFDEDRQMILTWERRHNIIVGVARGLLYLHQDSNFRIIHRDLKASNILLDEQMNPKISDFGLARMLGRDDATNKTRKVVGTYGYMAPEYAMGGLFSVKSDVFSFGVLMLEVISGQKNKASYHYGPQINLLGRAWSLWNEGRGLELIDPLIGPHFNISEAARCIHVGLLCVQALSEVRPTMSSVVVMLVSDVTLPEPKEPGFPVTRLKTESASSSDNHEVHSVNYMSSTMVVGR